MVGAGNVPSGSWSVREVFHKMRKMPSVEKEIRDDTYFNVTSLNPAATRIIHSELLPVMRNGISPGP